MKITLILDQLRKILERHGDVECVFDCPHCKATTTVGAVVTGPPAAHLKEKSL